MLTPTKAHQNDSEDSQSRFLSINGMQNGMQENTCPWHVPTDIRKVLQTLRKQVLQRR